MNSIFDPSFQNSDIASKIVFALERVSQVFKVNLWRENKKHGLSPLQIQILLFLHFQNDEDKNVSHLALEFSVTKATISEAVRTLEKKGYLVKARNPDDARNIMLRLTPKGKAVVPELSLFANELRGYVLGFDKETQEQFLTTLLSLINQLQENGHISMQRMCFSCQHFAKRDDALPYYCKLLDKSLKEVDLRINCLEHQPKA